VRAHPQTVQQPQTSYPRRRCSRHGVMVGGALSRLMAVTVVAMVSRLMVAPVVTALRGVARRMSAPRVSRSGE